MIASGDKKAPDITNTLETLAIIAALYYLLQSFGILNNMVPSRLADSGMGYGMLFVIGLISSVHCIAMCGGIGLSQSLSANKQANSLLPAMLYNCGRVCSYTMIGLILGFAGSLIGGGTDVGVPLILQSILKITAGIAMMIMGINMLGIFPWLRRFTIHTPMAVARLIGGKRMAAKGPFIIGLLNGIMPCGPLQAMWIVAFASASPVSGALSMFMFSLGTVPLMLGLGSIVSLLGKRFTSQVMKVGAILVVVMGLAMFTQGGALSGMMPVVPVNDAVAEDEFIDGAIEESAEGSAEESIEESPQIDDGIQFISSNLERGRYPDITVKAGVPVHWVIDAPAENINGCNGVMIIPNYGVQQALQPGENIIEFTPQESGVFNYSCWMGMVYGRIYVED